MSLRCYGTMTGAVPVGFCRSRSSILLAAFCSLSLALAWSAPASAQTGARCPGPPGDVPCLIIVKQTIGGTGTFNFAIDGGGQIQAQIDTSVQNPNQAGSFYVDEEFTVTEEPAPGFELTSISCVQRNQVLEFDPAGRVASIVGAQPDELVTCTFVNRRLAGSLTINKVTVGGDDQFDFEVRNAANAVVGTANDLANGDTQTFASLPPGQYTIEEMNLPQGWRLDDVNCGQRSGNRVTVQISASATTECTFVNRFASTDPERKVRDERMRDVTRLFINRRVDNLLSHDPDRARMLRRLQPGRVQQGQMSANFKETTRPLKRGTRAEPNLGQPYTGAEGGLFANQGEDDQPWALRDSRQGSVLSSIMGQLSGMTGTRNSYKFGMSLSQLRGAAAASHARDQDEKLRAGGLGFAGQPYGVAHNTTGSGIDFWVEGHFSRYNDGAGGIDRDGRFRVLYAGADYLIAPGLLVGALVQIDDAREDVEEASLSGEVEGTGWLAGPYIAVRLADTLFLDVRAAWGRADNDIWLSDAQTGFRTGSFDSDRWLATAKLIGNYQFGTWRLTPEIAVAYGDESYDTYLNSLGQIVDNGDARIGRFTGGAEIGYAIKMGDGAVLEPHVSLKGIWNFKTDDVVVGGIVTDFDQSRGRVEAGILYRTATGWALRGAGAYDGIGSGDLDAYTGELWLNVPLN